MTATVELHRCEDCAHCVWTKPPNPADSETYCAKGHWARVKVEYSGRLHPRLTKRHACPDWLDRKSKPPATRARGMGSMMLYRAGVELRPAGTED